jgi:hypothetical protein
VTFRGGVEQMKEDTDLWQRDGRLVYKLRHEGWRKGKEIFENEYSISFQGAKGVPIEEVEALAQLVCDFLNSDKPSPVR